MLKLEVLPAGKGDCLLLHFGTAKNPRLAVIDGGPGGVYSTVLEPRLRDLRSRRKLSDMAPLPIDLLMVSHVDDDHVNGVLALAREMSDARLENKPQTYRPVRLWHNSFDDLIGNGEADTKAALTAQFGPAGFTSDGLPQDADIEEDALKVLASLQQGHDLRNYAKTLGWQLNPEFRGGLVQVQGSSPAKTVVEGLAVTVVGPLPPEVAALRKAHADWIAARNAKRKDAPTLIAAFQDKSIPNLSSIVVLVEDGQRRILLTGDARGDKVLAGLEATGLLPAGETLTVDVLKVPHHGSKRNAAPEFFKRILADTYVFSGNGEHGNPDRETIEMLLDARPEGGYTLHFTYPLAEIDEERRRHAEQHDKRFGDEHALTRLLLDSSPVPKLRIVQNGKPTII